MGLKLKAPEHKKIKLIEMLSNCHMRSKTSQYTAESILCAKRKENKYIHIYL